LFLLGQTSFWASMCPNWHLTAILIKWNSSFFNCSSFHLGLESGSHLYLICHPLLTSLHLPIWLSNYFQDLEGWCSSAEITPQLKSSASAQPWEAPGFTAQPNPQRLARVLTAPILKPSLFLLLCSMDPLITSRVLNIPRFCLHV
jgi:hypothetical protein